MGEYPDWWLYGPRCSCKHLPRDHAWGDYENFCMKLHRGNQSCGHYDPKLEPGDTLRSFVERRKESLNVEVQFDQPLVTHK